MTTEEKVTDYRMQIQEKREKRKNRAKREHAKGTAVKYEHLVGKIIDHFTVGEDDEEGLHRAIVKSRTKWGLKLSYDSEPRATYEYTRAEIQEDIDNGDLRVADLSVEDVIGRHIMHRFSVDDDELVWFRGFISSATKEQECLVIYEEVEDDEGSAFVRVRV